MISNLLKISSLMSSVSLDPMDEPIKAPAIQIRAGRSLINPLMARRAVETLVPMAELNLLVPGGQGDEAAASGDGIHEAAQKQQRADDEILCVSVHDSS